MPNSFKSWWSTLEKHEKSGLCVLFAFILGVMLFFLGTEIGKAIYEATRS
jgi:hypothetical protein